MATSLNPGDFSKGKGYPSSPTDLRIPAYWVLHCIRQRCIEMSYPVDKLHERSNASLDQATNLHAGSEVVQNRLHTNSHDLVDYLLHINIDVKASIAITSFKRFSLDLCNLYGRCPSGTFRWRIGYPQ